MGDVNVGIRVEVKYYGDVNVGICVEVRYYKITSICLFQSLYTHRYSPGS